MVVILHPTMLVTVRVLYYVPGTHVLAPDFIWQVNDVVPEIPRVHKFLRYWHDNLDAVISDVDWTCGRGANWRHIDA